MNDSGRYLDNQNKVKKLAELLENVKSLKGVRHKGEPESWTVAFSLSEIEESSSKLFCNLLPKLLSADLTDSERADLLHDVADELRHIDYHIRDCPYFSAFVPES